MKTINANLFDAVRMGDTQRVSDLLKKGADPNALNENEGTTPLHAAILLRYPEPMARILVDAGADVNAKDISGMTAWEEGKVYEEHQRINRSSYQGVPEFIKSKDSEHVNQPELHIAVYQGDTKRVSDLLKKGADVNKKNSSGATPLHVAVHLRHPEPMARILVDAGADIEAKDNSGMTAWEEGKKHEEWEIGNSVNHPGIPEFIKPKNVDADIAPAM